MVVLGRLFNIVLNIRYNTPEANAAGAKTEKWAPLSHHPGRNILCFHSARFAASRRN